MNLYVLRHGIAVEQGHPQYSKDSKRPLTDEGERKVKRIAEAMLQMEVALDVILSSPYVRARQTAVIVAEAFDMDKKMRMTDNLKPGGNQEELIGLIRHLNSSAENVL